MLVLGKKGAGRDKWKTQIEQNYLISHKIIIQIILLTHWIFFALLFKEEARSQLIMFQGCVFVLRFSFSMKQRPNMLCDKIRNDSVLLGRKPYAEGMSLWALKILEIGCDKM